MHFFARKSGAPCTCIACKKPVHVYCMCNFCTSEDPLEDSSSMAACDDSNLSFGDDVLSQELITIIPPSNRSLDFDLSSLHLRTLFCHMSLFVCFGYRCRHVALAFVPPGRSLQLQWLWHKPRQLPCLLLWTTVHRLKPLALQGNPACDCQ